MPWWDRHFGDTTRGRLVALLRRNAHSVEELAAELGVTDNAVRAQLATLEREGVVRAASIRRDGSVGKPATLYAIAPGADTIFSTAYAPVLAALLVELDAQMTPARLESLLRSVGRRLASASAESPRASSLAARVRVAADVLAQLGADAEVVRDRDGYTIVGHATCPLAQAVTACPRTCHAVESLLAEVSGATVTEHCERSTMRCSFVVHG